MQKYLDRLNYVFSSPSLENVLSLFMPDSFIRFNMIYISPITLDHLKSKLESLGMVSWEVTPNGINFLFYDFQLQFRGHLTVYGDDRIFSVELDFEPLLNKNEKGGILNELESYLKGCDSIFFMSYFINSDFEILSNSLANSISYLGRRVVEKRKEAEKM